MWKIGYVTIAADLRDESCLYLSIPSSPFTVILMDCMTFSLSSSPGEVALPRLQKKLNNENPKHLQSIFRHWSRT